MAAIQLITYKEIVDYVISYMGGDVSTQASRDARQAVQNAYLGIANAHRWSYYYRRGRLATVAPQTTGTVAFDYEGGTYPRMLTLSDATWPTWATYGTVVIGDVSYDVAEYVSPTVITLLPTSNPGEDVAAGTSYTLYRDTYELPIDFIAADEMINVSHSYACLYRHPREWLNRQQIFNGCGAPSIYTIVGDENYTGSLAVKFYPAPERVYQFDYLYQRRPRQIQLEEYKVGFASAAAAGTTITGTNTAWTSCRLTGAVIRLGSNANDVPTGLVGPYPYSVERVVMSVTDATTLEVDFAIPSAYTGVKYTISDSIDIERGVMYTAFLRLCDREISTIKRMKSLPDSVGIYMQELREGMAADSRNFSRRVAGGGGRYGRRLADMPRGDDLP